MFYLSSKKIQKVIYESKDGKQEKVFDALEWPALLNFPKGTLFNRASGHACPCVSARRQVLPCPEQRGAGRLRHSGLWLRRLKWSGTEVDPLTCPKCRGKMQVISWGQVVQKRDEGLDMSHKSVIHILT